jgi:hypothetical protein
MNKKVYVLKGDLKYKVPTQGNKEIHNLMMYITKRKLQETLKIRQELVKKYGKNRKRINDWLALVILYCLHLALVGLMVLLSKGCGV